MYSSSVVLVSKPGPNLTLARMLSRVAGELNRADAGGFGGSDWPGAAAPPAAEGAVAVAAVPVSGAAVPRLAVPPAVLLAPEGTLPGAVGPRAVEAPLAGAIRSIWVESRLT